MTTINGGIKFNDEGAVFATIAVPSSTATAIGAQAISSVGEMYMNSLGATAVPASAIIIGGRAYTQAGALYVTTDAPGVTTQIIGGIAVRGDGAVHITTALVSGGYRISGLTATSTGVVYVASLSLSFMGAALPSATTLTRASSNGTRFNSAGVLVTEAANVARFAYSPSLSLRGLLNEPAATNLILWSNDLTNAAWTKRGTISVVQSVVSDGPDGTSNYTVDTNVTGSGGNDVFQGVGAGVGNNAPYAPSLMIRMHSTSGVLSIDQPSNSALGQWLIDASLFPNNSWQLVNQNSTQAGLSIAHAFVSDGAGSGGLHFARNSGSTALAFDVAYINAQSQASPTSVIATTTASATRSADIITVAIPDGTYDIDIVRESGTTNLLAQVISGGYAVPTSASPVQSVTFRRAA